MPMAARLLEGNMNSQVNWMDNARKFMQRVHSLPDDQKSAHALIEIAVELKELNAGLDKLIEAIHAVAKSPFGN